MSGLDRQLQAIARVPVLLVASDYDGTIAPIVSDPASARPCREAVVALRTLAGLPQTHVAVISGRALHDLATLTGLPEEVHLVGSHGSEFDVDFPTSLPPRAKKLRERLDAELSEIARDGDGLLVERKPASIAFHYRNASEAEADRALAAVLDGPATIEGVYTKHGKKVVELGVVSTNQGDALESVRHRVGASAVVFLGDDRTDEDAFRTLTGPDVAVKVGQGDTLAPYRIAGPDEVARRLARLSELRADWLAGSDAVPIETHAMLSDQRTAALVTPAARITWLCVPRLDSPALFAELLGGPAAGHFSISAAGGEPPRGQRYDERSLVLHTEWPTFTVTDFLDCSAGRPTRRAGRSDLIRIVEGRGPIEVEFAPRLDFGRHPTRLRRRAGGLEVDETLDPIVLLTPGVSWTIHDEGVHQTARARVDLNGNEVVFELRYGSGDLRAGSVPPGERRRLTEMFWSTWCERLVLPSIEPGLVQRSALALRGLWYAPTGAMAAAATTSLPEHMGGVRNWDYRYCWLRDTALAAAALVKLGSNAEAMKFLDWVLGVLDSCGSPSRLRPLYTLTGDELGPEAEIAELAGYRGSRPVRVGNSASGQVQLDVFGPIVELIALLLERDAPLSSEHGRLVEAMVRAVECRWHEPDHGIWEIRRPPRHHVHSKTMCWV
ncbi:MAG: trehalose-phosphatase, partial [Alphaproteobacteria bacterium]